MLDGIKTLLLDQAPQTADALLPPATDEDIHLLRQSVDGELPTDLVDLYKSSKGIDPQKSLNFAYGVTFTPMNQATSIVKRISDSNKLVFADSGIDKSYTFTKARIPIGDDSGSFLVCVDLKPTNEGNVGQVILIDLDYRVALKLASSVTEYLHNFERDLASNKYSLAEDALDDGVHWLMPVKEINPVHWNTSPTWEYVRAWYWDMTNHCS